MEERRESNRSPVAVTIVATDLSQPRAFRHAHYYESELFRFPSLFVIEG